MSRINVPKNSKSMSKSHGAPGCSKRSSKGESHSWGAKGWTRVVFELRWWVQSQQNIRTRQMHRATRQILPSIRRPTDRDAYTSLSLSIMLCLCMCVYIYKNKNVNINGWKTFMLMQRCFSFQLMLAVYVGSLPLLHFCPPNHMTTTVKTFHPKTTLMFRLIVETPSSWCRHMFFVPTYVSDVC